MLDFDWSRAATTLSDFGGEAIRLHVRKTGLPFFDAVQLYGAIDMYIGVREDVEINDSGVEWIVEGRSRGDRLRGRDEAAFHGVWHKKRPVAQEYCARLRQAILTGDGMPDALDLDGPGRRWDAVLQAGIRGVAARDYLTLQSGQTSRGECKARVPLLQGILAFAGERRVESIGELVFLPLFQGQIDLSKVVSPLRAWAGVPNVLCAQALVLLALRGSLFAEGYQDRLTGVVFNTNFGGQRSDNYSGLVTIASTAVGKMSSGLVVRAYAVLRALVGRAWRRQGKSYQVSGFALDALAMAYWLMQPRGKHLSAMIASQERAHRSGQAHSLVTSNHVREIFHMTYGDWNGDHEAVRRFAKAVAWGIYYARMVKEKKRADRQEVWYAEATMLRSAPSAKAFIERAMLLIEQGHREQPQVGTIHSGEAFDPRELMDAIGAGRSQFEKFRELFRMYLVQESTYPSVPAASAEDSVEPPEPGLAGGVEGEDEA